MSSGLFGIGISGMQAAQLGLLTTEHNVANASTPGYNRQRILQATNVPLMTGAGAVGQGTHVTTIERMYSEFLAGQVNTSQTSVSELDTYYGQIKQIDNMLADPNSGLSPALQDFFKGVQQVAANPSSIPSRQSMTASASSLVARIHGIEDRLSQMSEGVNGQITTTVGTINSYAQQIANLNERIVLAQSASNQPANDLVDQRDQLVTELNKLVKVSTATESDGSYNVFIGTGQQLVVGTRASAMTATASAADPSRIVVGLETAGGAQELPEYLITGGQLGGLVRFRSESLDPALNEIGRVAASMALTFNAQQALGQDLQGRAAGDTGFAANFFDMTNMGPSAIKNAHNTGNGVLQAAFVSPPPMGGTYTLSNTAGTYTLTRQSDGKTWTGASPAGVVDANGDAPPVSEGLNLAGATVAPGLTATLTSSTIPANFYTNLTASDYQLVRDGVGSYTLTRMSDNHKWNIPADAANLPGLSSLISQTEGFTLNLASGTINVGDSYLIRPSRAAARNIAVDASVAADARLVAAAAPLTTRPATGNVGKMTLSQGAVAPGYAVPSPALTLSATATQLTGFPAGVNVTAVYADGTSIASNGGPVNLVNGTSQLAGFSFNGMSFDVNGSPVAGDSFTIERNAGGVDDGRNIFLLGKLQTANTMGGRTASYQGAYAQFVSTIGNKTRETQVTGEAQQALLDQAQGAREALSGVNLDEEAANLLRYQQAYQASAKMLDIGNKLFDTVLSIRS
ncbi:MAG TPA: flagellar hook-associated protein FlgK [Rhodocyclaceae bacterium]|nr:flagellar hook-associated protein FlgK [Rhodocyclaceae bacterium]